MKRVAVQILGQTLTVASDADEEWIKTLAENIDQRMREVQSKGRTVVSLSAAIAVALNLADELERLKREHEALVRRIASLNQKLAGSLQLAESAEGADVCT